MQSSRAPSGRAGLRPDPESFLADRHGRRPGRPAARAILDLLVRSPIEPACSARHGTTIGRISAPNNTSMRWTASWSLWDLLPRRRRSRKECNDAKFFLKIEQARKRLLRAFVSAQSAQNRAAFPVGLAAAERDHARLIRSREIVKQYADRQHQERFEATGTADPERCEDRLVELEYRFRVS